MSDIKTLKQYYIDNPCSLNVENYISQLEQQNKKMLEALINNDSDICFVCKVHNPQHINCVICDAREQRTFFIKKMGGKPVNE